MQQHLFLLFKLLYMYNESTTGADASTEALKLYDMKLLEIYIGEKSGNDRP